MNHHACRCLFMSLSSSADRESRDKASIFSYHAGVLDQNTLTAAPRLAQQSLVNHMANQWTRAFWFPVLFSTSRASHLSPGSTFFFSVPLFFQESSVRGDHQKDFVTILTHLWIMAQCGLPDDFTIRVYFVLLQLGTLWTFCLGFICLDYAGCITFNLSQDLLCKAQDFDLFSMLSFKTISPSFQQVAV